jgi:hypothetical protein
MNYADPTIGDVEQHEIAAEILLHALTLVLDKPGALNRGTAATALWMAADERRRQGDFRASTLLDQWAETLAETMGN